MQNSDIEEILRLLQLEELPNKTEQKAFVTTLMEYHENHKKDFMADTGSNFFSQVHHLIAEEIVRLYWNKLKLAIHGYEILRRPIPLSANPFIVKDARNRTLQLIHTLGSEAANDVMSPYYVDIMVHRKKVI
jgi:hypothetical protein